MEKIITPYNLAEQVKRNTKKINDNTMDIDELYNLVDTIPDTSGFYTKTQTDTLLLTKVESKKGDINQEGEIYYSETNFSPTMSKTNLTTGEGTQLRLLSNSIAINKIQNGVLDYFIPQDPADITTKKYVDENLESKASQIGYLQLENRVINNENDITDLSSDVSILSDNLESATENIETNRVNIEESKQNIETNTSSIETLNNLIEQSFNTFGSYTSPLGSATDQVIRPILTENIPLDTEYVEAATTPEVNLFTNKKEGRIIFTISLSNLTNPNETEATIGLNIYYNDELILEPSATVPASWSGSRTITGALTVEADSTVYVEFVVGGTLSVDAPIQYNIEYNSSGLISSPSSQITNDKTINPDIGINPDLNTITTNSTRISANEENITNLNNQISNLNTLLATTLNQLIPIGTIIISNTKPTYGTWVSLGTLDVGQTITGGNSSLGKVMVHTHPWAVEGYKTEMSHKDISTLKGVGTYDEFGNNNKRLGDEDYVDGTYPGPFYTGLNDYTAGVGIKSTQNIPYSIGLGEGFQVWQRTV